MTRNLKLFVGLPLALAPFRAALPAARLYTLTPDADLAVLPFDEALQDRLHDRFGTGDWPVDQVIALSTTDQAFAAECSLAGPLAFLQVDEDERTAIHCAAVWQLGGLTVGPACLDLAGGGSNRAPSLRPINVALRALGVAAAAGADEFATFGLADYATNAEIHSRAWPLRS